MSANGEIIVTPIVINTAVNFMHKDDNFGALGYILGYFVANE